MPRRPRIILFFALLLAFNCRREEARVDDAQRMVAYAVKPGVVRISAYATAEYRYPTAVIAAIERELRTS